MKKTILAASLIALAGGAIYYKRHKKNLMLMVNNHQQAAHQFWFSQQANLNEKGMTHLPLTKDVETFEYQIGDATKEDNGKYYFNTTIYVNNSVALPLYTVVESIEGDWVVNMSETFLTVNQAALKRASDYYAASLDAYNQYIASNGRTNANYGQLSDEEQLNVDSQIEALLEENFKEAKKSFRETLIKTL